MSLLGLRKGRNSQIEDILTRVERQSGSTHLRRWLLSCGRGVPEARALAASLLRELAFLKISKLHLVDYCADLQEHLASTAGRGTLLHRAASFAGHTRFPTPHGDVRAVVRSRMSVVTALSQNTLNRHFRGLYKMQEIPKYDLFDDDLRKYWQTQVDSAVFLFRQNLRRGKQRSVLRTKSPHFFYVTPKISLRRFPQLPRHPVLTRDVLGIDCEHCFIIMLSFKILPRSPVYRPSWFAAGPRPNFFVSNRSDNWGRTRRWSRLRPGVREALHPARFVPRKTTVRNLGYVGELNRPTAAAWTAYCDDLLREVSDVAPVEVRILHDLCAWES